MSGLVEYYWIARSCLPTHSHPMVSYRWHFWHCV